MCLYFFFFHFSPNKMVSLNKTNKYLFAIKIAFVTWPAGDPAPLAFSLGV